jgi:ArsR family transcriptional regulator
MCSAWKRTENKYAEEVKFNGDRQMSDDVNFCSARKIEEVDPDKYEDFSRILGVLGNKSRIAILDIISKYGSVCSCELQPALGLPQPTATAHLLKMYEVGLLKRREEWKFSYYFINPRYESLVRQILSPNSNRKKEVSSRGTGKRVSL